MNEFVPDRRAARGLLLAMSLTLAGTSCLDQENGAERPELQGLRNGSNKTFRFKGLVDLSDDYNDLTSDLSGVHCTGIMLNQSALLTTARCAERVMRPGNSVEYTQAFRPDVYSWYDDFFGTGFRKHCQNNAETTCNKRDNNIRGIEEGDDKIEKVRVYSLTASPENDLAIITAIFYPAHTGRDDHADIYLDDFTPTTMPRLQLYGWGRASDTTTYPLPVPRTGTMQVRTVTSSRIDLNPDQVQACAGDEGGAWVVPESAGASGNKVVALESSFTADPNTRCSQSGTLDKAVRLRDKADWIRSVLGTCVDLTDASGHRYMNCDPVGGAQLCAPVSDSASPRWDGCNGSGCSVCDDQIGAAYPKYFEHHRNCSRNTACNGSYSRCGENCPPPTIVDSCNGLPDEHGNVWDGCRGSGCTACSDLIDVPYPKYFANHPECTRNTTCGGDHSRCAASCPPPTDQDR